MSKKWAQINKKGRHKKDSKNKIEIKKNYDWLGVIKETKERFLHTMRGSDTQDSFLNKLLDLYDKMIGSKILNKIENKKK